MYVILNQGVDGAIFPPNDPSEYDDGVALRVEYVRVYAAADGGVS